MQSTDRLFQSLGKGATQALRYRLWSIDASARAMWPKNLRRVVQMTCVSGGWSVRRQTSSIYGLEINEGKPRLYMHPH